jgi:hypothetical protein
MSFKKLEEVVSGMVGKKILSPEFLGSMNPQNTLNKTFFSNFDGLNKAFTTVTDKFGKIILYVEYDIASKIAPRDLHGVMVSCGGVVKEIEVNPEKTTDWIINIKVTEGYIKK